MRKNEVEPNRPQMKRWRMRIACWLPNSTNTHSKHEMLIAFPLQERFHEHGLMLCYKYTACLVVITIIDFSYSFFQNISHYKNNSARYHRLIRVGFHIKYLVCHITPWPQSASELYRQSGRRQSANLVPTFADRGMSRGQRNGSPRPLISVFWTGAATFLFKQLLN